MPAERPFVFINSAVTADGKLDTVERRGARISSDADLERVHGLRASAGAVMVGGYTLLHEDPSLTVKPEHLRAQRLARGLSENPIKVGIVSKIEDPAVGRSIPLDGRFLNAGQARVVVFTTERTAPEQIARLRERGAEVYVEGEQRVHLARALRRLKETGVERLMVEGGGTLNAELLRLRLVDEIHLYVAPLIFAGASAPTFADGSGLTRDEAVRLRLRACEPLEDGGIVVRYDVVG
jgi:2,5-diamino-6-(ribosylamino)-4(3H)-pyrimidinone 5'-phosphate reductase